MTTSAQPQEEELVAKRSAKPRVAKGGAAGFTNPTTARSTPILAHNETPSKGQSETLLRSQFARLFQKEGVNCVFHTINMRMVFGGSILRDLFEAFERLTPAQRVIDQWAGKHSADLVKQVIADLTQKGLLVQNAAADVGVYRRAYEKGMNQYRIQLMYFLPTTACNFRCTYCFVEDEDRHQKPCFMDTDTAELAVTTFARLNREAGHASIIFYGGEPLLNPKTTFYALRRLRQLEAEKELSVERISVLTNGSLVDDEAVRVLKETRPTLGVSIDGPQMVHDAARLDEHGRGTFAAALRGYKKLQDAGLKPGISCTLSAATIGRMDEIVDFILSDLKPSGMGFNLPLPQTGHNPADAAFDHEFGVQQLIRAFTRLREAGIYEDRVMRRVRPYQTQQFHCKDCMGVGGQIVVTPTGRVGPCQAYLGVDDDKHFPLDIRDLAAKGDKISAADLYSHPLFGEWCQRFPLNMRQCADCAAISVCGGGCPYAADVTDGSIWEVDERVCHQSKDILQWMIWDTHEHMKTA